MHDAPASLGDFLPDIACRLPEGSRHHPRAVGPSSRALVCGRDRLCCRFHRASTERMKEKVAVTPSMRRLQTKKNGGRDLAIPAVTPPRGHHMDELDGHRKKGPEGADQIT